MEDRSGFRQSGLTLIELAVTLGIVALLAVLAVPSFATVVRDNRVAGFTNVLMGSLQRARSEAVLRGHRVTVCVSSDQRTCSTEADWHEGWLVFADQDGDGALGPDEELLQIGNPAASLVATGNASLARYVSFTPAGQTRQVSGALQIGNIRVCSTDTGRALVMSATGRIRIDAVNC